MDGAADHLNAIINLDSPQGRDLLRNTELKNLSMIDLHKYQDNKTFCGPASLALVSNAINAGYRLKYQLIPNEDGSASEKLQEMMEAGPVLVNESEVLQCIDEEIVKKTKIYTEGLTLNELFLFATHLGFGVNCYYVLSEDKKDLQPSSKLDKLKELSNQPECFVIDNINDFKSRILRNVAHEGRNSQIQGIIMNYNIGILKGEMEGMGHFSPIGAYNKTNDMVLILDVWPGTKLEWVPLNTLWKSVAYNFDESSDLPRGFLHIYELM